MRIIANSISKSLNKGESITILPIARLKKRNLPQDLVIKLVKKIEIAGIEYKIYSYKKHSYINDFVYDSFMSLNNVILNSNFIICADSLQAHLCHLFKKPHFIYFPKNGKTDFLTPFALNFKYYDTFDQSKFNFLDDHHAY